MSFLADPPNCLLDSLWTLVSFPCHNVSIIHTTYTIHTHAHSHTSQGSRQLSYTSKTALTKNISGVVSTPYLYNSVYENDWLKAEQGLVQAAFSCPFLMWFHVILLLERPIFGFHDLMFWFFISLPLFLCLPFKCSCAATFHCQSFSSPHLS